MTATALKEREYVQDNVKLAEESEVKRRRIAREAEEACKHSVDFEEFILKYSTITGSDFA